MAKLPKTLPLPKTAKYVLSKPTSRTRVLLYPRRIAGIYLQRAAGDTTSEARLKGKNEVSNFPATSSMRSLLALYGMGKRRSRDIRPRLCVTNC